jgi:hypothetical protein
MKTILVSILAGLLASNVLAQDKPAAPAAAPTPAATAPAAAPAPAAGASAAPAAAADEKAEVPDEQVLKEKKAQETEEGRKAAAAARAAEDKVRREELFKACVIRPVMTDEEIEACKKAYRA